MEKNSYWDWTLSGIKRWPWIAYCEFQAGIKKYSKFCKSREKDYISRESLSQQLWGELLSKSRESRLSSILNSLKRKLIEFGFDETCLETSWEEISLRNAQTEEYCYRSHRRARECRIIIRLRGFSLLFICTLFCLLYPVYYHKKMISVNRFAVKEYQKQ